MRIDPTAISWSVDVEHPALWMVWYRGVPLDRVLFLFGPDTLPEVIRQELALWIRDAMAPLSNHERLLFLAGKGRSPPVREEGRWRGEPAAGCVHGRTGSLAQRQHLWHHGRKGDENGRS